MKALMLRALGDLALVDVDEPAVEADELLVQTGVTIICTSDLNDIRENPFGTELPVILGHEGAGTVVEIGPDVTGFRMGDRAATHPVHPCGHCSACSGGLPHLCRDVGHFGFNLQGTFAEYYVVRQDRARVIPDTVDFRVAALIEPVCCCLEGLMQARLSPGNSLLIMGDGPFGILTARLARAFGLSKVVIAGHHDFRLSFAGEAIRVNTANAGNPLGALLEETGGEGYDAVFVAVGSKQAAADGLKCLKPRGRLVIFSAIPGETPVDLLSLHIDELEIVGACRAEIGVMDKAMTMLSDLSLGLAEMVTHTFPIEEYQQAFALAEAGREEALKVAIVF